MFSKLNTFFFGYEEIHFQDFLWFYGSMAVMFSLLLFVGVPTLISHM